MLVLAGLAVDDHRSTREKRVETVQRHAEAHSANQLRCCGKITPNIRWARHPAAERGSVQLQLWRYLHNWSLKSGSYAYMAVAEEHERLMRGD